MEWQLPLISSLQHYSALLHIMQWFTFLGNEEFFLLMIPFVYLCIDARMGIRLGLIVLLGDALNSVLKLLFHLPRPYWMQPGLQLGTDTSYGLPSSHAQNAVSVWLFLASQGRRVWTWILAAILILLVSLSRVFLGVHFMTDILVGWIIGLLFLLLFLRFEPSWKHWLSRQPVAVQMGVVSAVTAALIVAGIVTRAAIAGTPDPAAWTRFSEGARGLEALISRAGGYFGLGIGAVLARRLARFDAGGPLLLRVARFLIGIIGLLLLWRGLPLILPGKPEVLALIFRFIRYALMTWWVTFLAPWLFLKSNLAQPEQPHGAAVRA